MLRINRPYQVYAQRPPWWWGWLYFGIAFTGLGFLLYAAWRA